MLKVRKTGTTYIREIWKNYATVRDELAAIKACPSAPDASSASSDRLDLVSALRCEKVRSKMIEICLRRCLNLLLHFGDVMNISFLNNHTNCLASPNVMDYWYGAHNDPHSLYHPPQRASTINIEDITKEDARTRTSMQLRLASGDDSSPKDVVHNKGCFFHEGNPQ